MVDNVGTDGDDNNSHLNHSMGMSVLALNCHARADDVLSV